jgi:hypothetical protein
VKSANEDFTCSMFRETINDFIDDSMPEGARTGFLAHAIHCISCNKQLQESLRLKKILGGLASIAVSLNFDTRLKERIRKESILLQNPLYRFKLFTRDNIKTMMVVPAAAFVIFVAVFSNIEIPFYRNNQPEITQNISSNVINDGVSTFEDDAVEVVNYVLDSVKQSEAETGIFLNEQNTTLIMTPNEPDILLINY